MPEEVRNALPELEEKLAININKDLKFLEDALAKNSSGYLVGGDLTLAEIMLAFSAHFILVRGLGAKWTEPTYPNIKKWLRRLQGRESWQRAAQQGENSYTLDAASQD